MASFEPPEHRLPVEHRGADIGEDRENVGLQLRQHRLVGETRDLNMHQAFADDPWRRGRLLQNFEKLAIGVASHGQNRMQHERDRKAMFVEERQCRIDKERHVVIGDVDKGDAGKGAGRIGDRYFRAARLAFAKKGQATGGERGKIGRCVGSQILGERRIEKQSDERLLAVRIEPFATCWRRVGLVHRRRPWPSPGTAARPGDPSPAGPSDSHSPAGWQLGEDVRGYGLGLG